MKRAGLHVRTNDVHQDVRQAVKRFAQWLRKGSDFPVRVPVYLSKNKWITTRENIRVSASFFAPFDNSSEPYIRIATGDYAELKRKYGRDRALAAILCSIGHEVIHYQQWCQGKQFREDEAVKGAYKMIRLYSKTTLHP